MSNKFYTLVEEVTKSKNSMGAINTRNNELITMYFIQQWIEFNKVATVDDAMNNFNAWDATWEQTYTQSAIATKKWLKGNTGYIYSRDKGFMEFISEIASHLGFKNKDVWNPADIWLVRGTKYAEIKSKLTDIAHGSNAPKDVKIEELNQTMRHWFIERDVVGISLKKITGKSAKFEETNVDKKSKLERYMITSMKVDFTLNKKEDDFISKELSYTINKNINVQIRAFPDKPSNVQMEVIGKGQAARFGKIPLRDTVDAIFNSYSSNSIKRLTYQKDIKPLMANFTSSDIKWWGSIYQSVITSRLNVKSSQTREEFESILEQTLYLSRINKKVLTHLSNKLQALYILFSYDQLYKIGELEDVTTQFLYGAKKQTTKAGPFVKLY